MVHFILGFYFKGTTTTFTEPTFKPLGETDRMSKWMKTEANTFSKLSGAQDTHTKSSNAS